ncbi:MAG: hypothetical protein KDD58_16135 [Bdellovibrionales bacterium]|nr:hypothetical protein [Bdellovibrionales bacterium]
MKKIILVLLLIFLGRTILADDYLQDDMPIKEHMLKMDRFRDAFFAALDDPNANDEEKLVHLKNLRVHFHRLFPKTPYKIQNYDKTEYQKAELRYQAQILKSLSWTIDMEKAITKEANTAEEKEKKDKLVKDLSHQLNVIVGKGHVEFR